MATSGPGFDLSTLTSYVDETSFELISKAVLGTNLAGYVDVRAGLKGNSVKVPLMEDDFTVQTGNNCGWSAPDSASITQVDLDIYHAKIQHEFCPQSLRDTFMAQALSAGQFGSSENIPYEGVYVNHFVEKLQNWNEKYLINGINGGNDGIQDILATSAVSASAIDTVWNGSTAGATAVDYAHKMFSYLPGEVSMADDLILVVGTSDYKNLALNITQQNYYHVEPNLKNLYVPGTNIRVVPSAGIQNLASGLNLRFLTRASNIIMGTDLTGDFEQFKMWYSEDNDQVRATMKWAIGVTLVQPELAVVANKTAAQISL